jgi:hypothetical protein
MSSTSRSGGAAENASTARARRAHLEALVAQGAQKHRAQLGIVLAETDAIGSHP